jgi:hypothetical protein
MMRGIAVNTNDEQVLTLAQPQAFLSGTVSVDFSVATEERYEFLSRTARRFAYSSPEAS